MTKNKYDMMIAERKNLFYLNQCAKKCPKCSFTIQKIDGCNKMTCSLCHAYFCWNCMAVLPHDTPYKHFENNPDCFLHATLNPVSEELT